MSINFTQRQTISAVEIGWSGVSINDLVIGIVEGSISEGYVNYLENRFGIKEGRFLREIREEHISDLATQIKAISSMCFEQASNSLGYKLDTALSERYQRTKANIRGEAIYRDPNSKELIEISAFNHDGESRISINSTNKDVARRLFLERMTETEKGFSIDTNTVVEGLENLSFEANPHRTIYWDPNTKGLIKFSSGYDLQIPDRIIEVTEEIDIGSVIGYIQNYLQSHKLPS